MSVVRVYGGCFEAIAAVCLDNRRLCALVGETRDYYVHGGEMPKDMVKLSVALRCEENDAHRLLENVMTQVKRFPRGKLPRQAIQYRLWGSSVRLLDSLFGTVDALSIADCDAVGNLRAAILYARNIECAISNFMMGISGADEHIKAAEYSVRLDKFLRDLKMSFNDIAVGFDRVERALARIKVAKRVRRKVDRPRCEKSAASQIKARDIADIRKEVNRRVEGKLRRGVSASCKGELERLCHDEAWARRCRQWPFDTLYTYIIRR